MKSSIQKNLFAYTLLLPSFIFLAVFTYYPTLRSFFLSFHSASVNRMEFDGLGQYKAVFGDEIFQQVLVNNIIFMIGTVPTSIFLAMYLAIWVNKKMMGSSLLRTSFFYPTVMPLIAIANIWLFIYTPTYGLLDKFLNLIGLGGMNYLGNPSTVMIAMIIMIIWKEAGFFMIFYLAGLQNLPADVYEAAKIEGAKSFYIFRKITFPLLMPTTLFVMIVAITNSFKNVDHLYIMTKGGPDNASNLLLYYIYQTGFSYWDLGKAAVITVVLIVILLSVSAFNYLYLDRKIHY